MCAEVTGLSLNVKLLITMNDGQTQFYNSADFYRFINPRTEYNKKWGSIRVIWTSPYWGVHRMADPGCNVWGLTTNENIEKIEILQKKTVRILSFAPFRAHTNQLFINLNLIKLRDIIKINQLMLVYDYYEGNLPADLMTLFRPSSEVHSTNMQLNSTIKSLIHIPTINTLTYGNRSIKYACAKLWNEFFARGIAIDSDRSHNISLRDIRNKQHL